MGNYNDSPLSYSPYMREAQRLYDNKNQLNFSFNSLPRGLFNSSMNGIYLNSSQSSPLYTTPKFNPNLSTSNPQPAQSTPINLSDISNALSKVGDDVGGLAGTVLSGLGGIGGAVANLIKVNKLGKSAAKGAKAGAIGAIVGAGADLISGFLPDKSEYSGEYGNVTQVADNIYDGIAAGAMAFGPIGLIVGGALSGAGLFGKVLNTFGGGTSGKTLTDALLGSSFLSLTPFGMINGFGGKKTHSITRDNEAFAVTGDSYTGTSGLVDEALRKMGKYGAFSSGARRRANRKIDEAKRQQEIVSNIADEATNNFAIMNSMATINLNRRALNMQGGINLQYLSVGKNGLKFDTIKRAKSILNKYKKQQVNLLQEGGPIGAFDYYFNTLPDNLKDTTSYRVKDYWEFNGRPIDFLAAVNKGMFSKDNKGIYHAHSVAENPKTGEIEYMKASNHPTRYMESDWYEKGLIYEEDNKGNTIAYLLKPGDKEYDNWVDFRNKYDLVKSEPYWKYVRKLKLNIISHKEGGTFIELSKETFIKPIDFIEEFKEGGTFIESANKVTFIELVDIVSIEEFKEGGSINVIPDGALHARLHHMDMEGITKKGIPVVSENNGEIELQAEVEKEEIIFRLEATQKLEELKKKFYSEESTQEEKDEYALEAGKLLVHEILYNTLDNTKKLL